MKTMVAITAMICGMVLLTSCSIQKNTSVQKSEQIVPASASTALIPDSSVWDTCYANPTQARKILSEDHSDVGQLDYSLFLYAFIQSPNEARNAQVKEITDRLVAKARKLTEDKPEMQVLFKGKISFDGSYRSLVSVLRILSCSGLVNTHSSFYAIPCPVVQGRPELLEATLPYFGNSLDERLPRCGLWYGRGSGYCHRRFPSIKAIDNYCKVLQDLSIKHLGRTNFDEARIRRVYERMLFKRHELLSHWAPEFKATYKQISAEQSPDGGTPSEKYAQLLQKVHEIFYSRINERIVNCPEFKAAFEQTKAAVLERCERDKFNHRADKEDLAVNTLYALAFAHDLIKSAPSDSIVSRGKDVKQNGAANIPDKILVEKGKRMMSLYRQGVCLKTYKIALGSHPIGHKQQEGDNKTPEGVYKISLKNPRGTAGKTLLISYPNDEDRRQAKLAKRNPGGNVCIHGLWPSLRHLGTRHIEHDWTFGCIAVTDEEIEEIYKIVKNDTIIEILP
jgi:hypothetical protein